MIKTVLSSHDAVTLLGAGALEAQTLSVALNRAPQLVAADGGVRVALEHDLVPDAVIGDFDSLPAQARAQIPADHFHHITEQESTDFEKCLRRIEAPLIHAVGFTGKRLDHELAVYNALVREPAKRCIVYGSDDICILCPARLKLDLPIGARVSLFPLGAVQGHSTGLNWPIEGIAFAPDGAIGTSNHSACAQVELTFEAPKMLLILDRAHLSALEVALRAAPHWPVLRRI
jgi:thiamine pyrophosphokinase